MKQLIDKKGTDKEFSVEDMLYIRLQPYIQGTITQMENHKLLASYFRAFKVEDRVGKVAY